MNVVLKYHYLSQFQTTWLPWSPWSFVATVKFAGLLIAWLSRHARNKPLLKLLTWFPPSPEIALLAIKSSFAIATMGFGVTWWLVLYRLRNKLEQFHRSSLISLQKPIFFFFFFFFIGFQPVSKSKSKSSFRWLEMTRKFSMEMQQHYNPVHTCLPGKWLDFLIRVNDMLCKCTTQNLKKWWINNRKITWTTQNFVLTYVCITERAVKIAGRF